MEKAILMGREQFIADIKLAGEVYKTSIPKEIPKISLSELEKLLGQVDESLKALKNVSLIKSYTPYLPGDFSMDDVALHKKGINRLGNILVPNDRYILLEKKIQPIFKKIYERKKTTSPSELVYEIGKTLDDKNSIMYWATKNNIPIFSPGITDSALGLQTYFFKQDHPDFGIDVTGDMKKLADIVLNAEKTGGIILGGGISKHHTIGVNVVREGLDYAVYITTSQPWDGSLSGARTNEAKSWGKIKEKANSVTIDGDATIIFPLIFSAVFEGK
jgi:deoxyhypusine synthase